MDAAESAEAARGFVRALYGDTDRVAVLAVGRRTPTVHQRIRPSPRAQDERFQAWLRHLNAQGHDIFVGMNPIRANTKRREKADVAEVRRLQLDLDDAGPDSLRRVLADASAGRIPLPAIVVRSSENRYQVLWHTRPGWSPDQAEDTMARLAQHYGGDPAVADVARCMRLPGFRNKKDGRDDALVRWTDYKGRPVDRAAFDHLPPRQRIPGDSRRPDRPRGPRPMSQSERDWAEVREQLREGAQPAHLIEQLAQQRPDKPNPHYYAQRTVRRAGESLRQESSHRNPGPAVGRGRRPPAPAGAYGNAPFRIDATGPGR